MTDAQRAEEARRRRVAANTVEFAPNTVEQVALRLITDSALVPIVRRAASAAWTDIDHTYGVDARSLPRLSIIVRRDRVATYRDSTDVIQVIREDETRPAAATTIPATDLDDAERQLARAIAHASAEPMFASLDSALRRWLRVPLPPGSESSDERAVAYIDLATASTPGSRRCLAGDLMGCAEYVGLRPPPDLVRDGLSATIRRRLVVERPALRTTEVWREYDRCALELDDDACDLAARQLSEQVVDAALSPTSGRRSFLRWAIEHGGDGAFARLREAPDASIERRIAASGAMSSDSLLASWHRAILAARPAEPMLPLSIAAMTLVWIGAASALALRSSRWR